MLTTDLQFLILKCKNNQLSVKLTQRKNFFLIFLIKNYKQLIMKS